MSAELPPGYAAWAGNRPVRRVATAGNPKRPAGTDPAAVDLPYELKAQLAIDVILYGDAWLDMNDERVDPLDVVLVGPSPN